MNNNLLQDPIAIVPYAEDFRLSQQTRDFLKVLNSPAPPQLEKLSPQEARQVLVDAQASVPVDLSGIEESETTIQAGGFSIKLNLVRPEGVKDLM